MKKNFTFGKAVTFLLSGIMMLSCTAPAFGATSTDTTNNTATINDLTNADIIDSSKKGTLSIYKYDITAAEAAGAYTMGDHTATGDKDAELETIMANYAVEGVEFSYIRLGDIETYSINGGTTVEVVYEIPDTLRTILGLATADAVNMTETGVSTPCTHTGVSHYTSQQLNDSLKDILADNDMTAKNALEDYVEASDAAVAMLLTDSDGYTTKTGLDLGLYLVVETEVPEQVVATCNPWFVSLPYTNEGGNWNAGTGDMEGQQGTEGVAGGQRWQYDITCYPKNQTGQPTLDKMVRNAHGTTASEAGRYEDYSYLVYNAADKAPGVEVSSNHSYVEARNEYTYDSTCTASEGDILDYILVSKLPHIENKSTYLTEYTFKDTMSKGLTYNKDVKIAIYANAADANVNDTTKAVTVWTADKYLAQYAVVSQGTVPTGETTMTISMTDAGLKEINENYADMYIVPFYSVIVNSDATTVIGDEGNPNNVTLAWTRTSEEFSNTLEDKCEVYTFGLNLTKTFSDNNGDATKVQFKLYNHSDAYYVIAEEKTAGTYYVTDKTAEQAKATLFSPAENGQLLINGIEGDTYQLTEIATDNGYSLLKDQITIVINATSETIIPSVAGATGLEAATTAGQNIDKHYNGGIKDATGTSVSASKGTQAEETANGRTTGKTAMYEGDKIAATATVDKVNATMSEADGSVHARVDISIMNSKTFLLPQTGGNGLYIVTIIGVVGFAFGILMMTRKKRLTSDS